VDNVFSIMQVIHRRKQLLTVFSDVVFGQEVTDQALRPEHLRVGFVKPVNRASAGELQYHVHLVIVLFILDYFQ